MRRPEKRPRILLGLRDWSGYFMSLEQGFRELGLCCDFVGLVPDATAYKSAEQMPLFSRLLFYAHQKRRKARPWAAAGWDLLYHLVLGCLFADCLRRYDVFIFGCGSSFFGFRELPLLKALGKRVVYVFMGSDVRPPYLNGAMMATSRGLSMEACLHLTRQRKAALRTIERYADEIVSHPPMAHFQERSFVLDMVMGYPVQLDARPATSSEASPPCGKNVRILHAPSFPEAKGTAEIMQVIASLRQKGHAIEFIQLTGVTPQRVWEELQRCDFVVDQLYADCPMAGFATEAAFFGKPVVVGGYYGEHFLREYPDDCLPPTLYCHPSELEQSIERLIFDPAYRQALGQQARAFAHTYLMPKEVAHRYLRLLTGDVPASWRYDPRRIRFVHGACLPEARARELVAALLAEGGVEALQLADKPELEQLLLRFAEGWKEAS